MFLCSSFNILIVFQFEFVNPISFLFSSITVASNHPAITGFQVFSLTVLLRSPLMLCSCQNPSKFEGSAASKLILLHVPQAVL